MRVRTALLYIFTVAPMVGACASSTEEAAPDEGALAVKRCTDLRRHVVDLRLEAATGPEIDLDGHRMAMEQALGSAFIDDCRATMTTEQVRCALDASSTKIAIACASRAKVGS